jgi:tetratricopeptide (TPR) repeat protein
MIQEVAGSDEVTFRFVHALVPSAIADSVRTLRRRKLHRRAAEAIKSISPSNYEALAFHYVEAGDDKQAYINYVKAGDRAFAMFANQDAETYYLSALDLVEDDRDQAHLQLLAGISLTYQSKHQQALKLWQSSIVLYQKLGEIDKVAELYARSSRAVWDDGDTLAGLDICRHGLSAVEGAADGPGFARLLSEVSRASFFNGLHKDSARYGHQALQIAERLNLPTTQADSLTTLGLLHDKSPEKPVSFMERATEIAEANNLIGAALRAHNNLSYLCTFALGNIPKGIYHMRRAIDLSQQIGAPGLILFQRSNFLYYSLHQGMLKEASSNLSDLQQIRDSLSGLGSGSANLYQLEFILFTYQGNFDQALKLVQKRIEEEKRTGDLQRLDTSYLSITLIHLLTGDLDSGRSSAQDLIELADSNMASKSVSRSLLSRIYSRMGEAQRAQQLLEQAQRKGEITQTHYYDQVFMHWAQADLFVAEEKWDEALGTYEELINLTGENNFRWFSRQASVDCAEVLLKRGEADDVQRAKEMLQESLQDYQQMGAEGFVARIESRLSDLE